MIPLTRIEIPTKLVKLIIRALAYHQVIILSSKGKDLIRLEAKDARKGQIYGRGSNDDKTPKSPRRIHAKFTNVIKDMLVKEENKVI